MKHNFTRNSWKQVSEYSTTTSIRVSRLLCCLRNCLWSTIVEKENKLKSTQHIKSWTTTFSMVHSKWCFSEKFFKEQWLQFVPAGGEIKSFNNPYTLTQVLYNGILKIFSFWFLDLMYFGIAPQFLSLG